MAGLWARKWLRNKSDRKRLKNKEFTILSNNCIGGVICHDLGQPFCSPTVNMYITPNDFVKFLQDPDTYLQLDLIPIVEKNPHSYPVAKLGDITILLKHFATIEEAREAWKRRTKRIDKNNLYVMMTDRWCCPYKILKAFDDLPYQHKICFTAREYPELPSCRQVTRWSENTCVGVITNIAGFTGKRLYEYAKNFDYIDWLNE